MWYGCLPSAAVIGVVMTLPYIVFYFDNKYIIGNIVLAVVSEDLRKSNWQAYRPYLLWVIWLFNSSLLFQPYRRFLHNRFDFHTYLRDMRLGNGDPYKQVGLECIQMGDVLEEKKVCECP